MSSSGTAAIVVELPFVPSHTSSTPPQSPAQPSLQASASSQSPTTEQPQPPPQPQVAQPPGQHPSSRPHLPTLPRFSKSWQNLSALIAIATIPVMVYYAVKTYQLAAWTAKKDYCEYQHAYGSKKNLPECIIQYPPVRYKRWMQGGAILWTESTADLSDRFAGMDLWSILWSIVLLAGMLFLLFRFLCTLLILLPIVMCVYFELTGSTRPRVVRLQTSDSDASQESDTPGGGDRSFV